MCIGVRLTMLHGAIVHPISFCLSIIRVPNGVAPSYIEQSGFQRTNDRKAE
jgi:hypothetical protein